ncbi:MAG: prolyl oligopeptidase family serine peptidase [Chloroflexota bacterium]|nr:prolyl oligopeptidase family serine peptidase [Chloroflexota bacterium]
MKRRRLIIAIVVIVLLLLVVGYAGASTVVYNMLSQTVANCSSDDSRNNTPAAFASNDVDTTPYLMPAFEQVSFPSRDANLQLNAWYVPATEGSDTARTVILVHGLMACKGGDEILLPAGMLHRAGYNVLMVDMRDHGASQVEDGRFAAGSEEWRDVLGAWDWLVNEQGIAPERIGLFGTSLGAAAVMIATGEEPRVAAVWEDSGFASIQVAVDAELARNGFPQFLSSGALFIGRLISGDDILAYSPLAAVQKLDGRPIFITHGTADTRLSVQYAYDLAAAVNASGGSVEPWIIEGSTHVGAMFDVPQEYEQRLIAFFDGALAGN